MLKLFLALAKIPCILLATAALHITATPPQPPPSKSCLAPSTSWEVVIKHRGGPAIVKLICWLAAFVEIFLITTQALGHQALTMSIFRPFGLQVDQSSTKFSSPSVDIHPSIMFLLGTSLAIAGGYIRHCCYEELGQMFTFEMSIMKDHRLVTTGPYAWARHPAYAGVLLTISGIVILHSASGSCLIGYRASETVVGKGMAAIYLTLTSMITIGLMKRMPKEDEVLAEKFGQEWREWARRVPFRLFWGIY
ncbi:hypothetical protein F5878DRAFT_583248 [Lentinula raphanica]|uniref:Protein-S-isoprenylcysteine O-methyltransferase n=1 Tax=Lentinula raphanica TaxID=153919 RepID=A0AA38P9F6_9AGAR|nr:hypothetical protein F5880DRAFT_457070 [Lentinula raphanica]KAJ3838528.1 hypothetical protein F5878DRAFT_583248 [Lentinula raphanica]